MGRLKLSPVTDHYDRLNRAAREEYTLPGDATHVAETELGETVLLFPRTKTGERPYLIFSDVPAFLRWSAMDFSGKVNWSEGTSFCPEEGSLTEWEQHSDGDISVGTTVTL